MGFKRPITFSGGGRTAHKLMGYLSAEDGYFPGYDYLALVEHGVGLVEHTPPGWASLEDWLRNGHSGIRCYGYSDDGTDCHPWNQIPPEQAGTYDKAGGSNASPTEKVKILALFSRVFGERLVLVEFLPREISFDEGPDALADQSLEAFWRVGKEVFGHNIMRIF